MAKRQRLSDEQKQRVSDCIDSLRLHAIPEKWKQVPGYTEQVKKTLMNVVKGLKVVRVSFVDVAKAIECIDYGRKDLAYKYLYESSKIKDPAAQQLDAKYGVGNGQGAVNDLFSLLING